MSHAVTALGLVVVLTLAGGAAAQTLTLKGLAPNEVRRLTAAEFATLPHQTLTVDLHGRMARFEGVPMLELLRAVDAPWGDTLTGKDLADVVLVTCHDGYRVAYSLGEIDPGTAKGQVLVADRRDGAPLDAHSGPFQIVVQDDARPARDARMVETIELVRVGAPAR